MIRQRKAIGMSGLYSDWLARDLDFRHGNLRSLFSRQFLYLNDAVSEAIHAGYIN